MCILPQVILYDSFAGHIPVYTVLHGYFTKHLTSSIGTTSTKSLLGHHAIIKLCQQREYIPSVSAPMLAERSKSRAVNITFQQLPAIIKTHSERSAAESRHSTAIKDAAALEVCSLAGYCMNTALPLPCTVPKVLQHSLEFLASQTL